MSYNVEIEKCSLTSQELIQNAEDANASTINFILDERTYGKKSLLPKVDGKEGFERMQVFIELLTVHNKIH